MCPPQSTTYTTPKILTGNQPSVFFPVPGLLNNVGGNHVNMQIAFFENAYDPVPIQALSTA